MRCIHLAALALLTLGACKDPEVENRIAKLEATVAALSGTTQEMKLKVDTIMNSTSPQASQQEGEALAKVLSRFASDSAEDRETLKSITDTLKQDYTAEQSNTILLSFLLGISKNIAPLKYETGVNILNDKGEVDPKKLARAIPKLKRFAERNIPKQWRHQFYERMFNSSLAAGAFMRAEFASPDGNDAD